MNDSPGHGGKNTKLSFLAFFTAQMLCKFHDIISNKRVGVLFVRLFVFEETIYLYNKMLVTAQTSLATFLLGEGYISLASKRVHRHLHELCLLQHCRRDKCQSSSFIVKRTVLSLQVFSRVSSSQLCRTHIFSTLCSMRSL